MRKLFFLLALGVSSCANPEEKLSQAMEDNVMKLHDDLMGKTGQMMDLKPQLDRLSQGKDSIHVKKLLHALNRADQSMMDWMHQFSLDSLGKMTITEKLSYLKNQYRDIQRVQTITDSTLHAAKNYIK